MLDFKKNIFHILVFFLFISCVEETPEKKISIRADSLRKEAGKSLQLSWYSLDSALFRSSEKNICEGKFYDSAYKKQVFDYIRTFLYNIKKDSVPCGEIISFVSHRDMKDIYKEIDKKYPSSFRKELIGEFSEGLIRYKACFPLLSVPKKIVFVHSGFNYAFFHSGDAMLCGLDMYLGRYHTFYDYAGIPRYKSRVMDPVYLPVDFIKACWLVQLDTVSQKNNLLDYMVHYGKMYYLLHLCFPEKHDSILLGYTTQQMNYLKRYQSKVWKFLSEKNKLFDHNMKTIHDYTSEGPFTTSISKECPPRIAHWFGYQIMLAFQEKHPELMPENIMKITDAKKILFESKYKP
jgi:hypothetical protein